MDSSNFLQPKKGMTSVEAAALYLSNGQTRDPELAVQINDDVAHTFDIDALERAAIRRNVGFDFSVNIDTKRHRFLCTNDETGYKTTAYYQDMDEKAIKRLVRALGRLKKQHDDSLQDKH